MISRKILSALREKERHCDFEELTRLDGHNGRREQIVQFDSCVTIRNLVLQNDGSQLSYKLGAKCYLSADPSLWPNCINKALSILVLPSQF